MLKAAAGLLLAAAAWGQQPQPAAAPLPITMPPPSAQSYLYIEPYQARFEALFPSTVMLAWLGQPSAADTVLDAAAQQQLAEKAAALAAEWCVIKADGQIVQGSPVAASVVKGAPGNTLPLKEGESLRAAECMTGLLWDVPVSGVPESIEVRWQEFREPLTLLPAKIFFGSLSESGSMTAASPEMKWTNNRRLPYPKTLVEVPAIPEASTIPIPAAAIAWLAVGWIYYLIRSGTGRKPRGGWLGMMMAWLFGAAILVPMSVVRVRNPFVEPVAAISTPQAAAEIVSPLLKNIYRAFDHSQEAQIYDMLARSVDGELLRKLYLDTIEALTIEGREGARSKVSELDVHLEAVQASQDLSFVTEGQWTALGSVGHWGHNHTRVNRYKARLTVRPVAGEWKISGLEVLELRRL